MLRPAASSSSSARPSTLQSTTTLPPPPSSRQRQPTTTTTLKGYLRIIQSQISSSTTTSTAATTTTTTTTAHTHTSRSSPFTFYDHDVATIHETQSILQNRRRRRRHQHRTIQAQQHWLPSQDHNIDYSHQEPPSQQQQQQQHHQLHHRSLQNVVSNHRFVAFFVVQGNKSNHYSRHTLTLRKRLALDFYHYGLAHNSNNNSSSSSSDYIKSGTLNGNEDKHCDDTIVTILIEVPCSGGQMGTETESGGDTVGNGSILGAGTGFVGMEYDPTILTILNITQLPTLVVIDTITGRPLSSSGRHNHHRAMAAIEYNDPDIVIEAWKRGQSGLTCCQSIWTTATCQDLACTIS